MRLKDNYKVLYDIPTHLEEDFKTYWALDDTYEYYELNCSFEGFLKDHNYTDITDFSEYRV